MADYALKCKVNMLYDLQRLRIQTLGRTNNEFAVVTLSPQDRTFLETMGKELETLEKEALKHIKTIVRAHPLWDAFLSNTRGIGEQSASVLLSTIDIHRANTVSAVWMYTGLGVVPHVTCSKCGHVSWHNKGVCQKVIKDKKTCGGITVPIGEEKGIQRPIPGEKISYNKWLRTKLLGVIGANFIKLSSPYRKFYDDYKNRLVAKGWGKSKKHVHNASIRYMMKMFLIDLYKAWRTLEKLPVREPYAVEYLGKHAHPEAVVAVAPLVDVPKKRSRKKTQKTHPELST
jgi:hypothetical protein